VNKDCKKNSIYWGSPAKKIHKRKNNKNYLWYLIFFWIFFSI
jgi:hypothetical protein